MTGALEKTTETTPHPHPPATDVTFELLPGERALCDAQTRMVDEARKPARWRRPKAFRGHKEKKPKPPRESRTRRTSRPKRKRKLTIWTFFQWYDRIRDPFMNFLIFLIQPFMDFLVLRLVYRPLCRLVYRLRDGSPLMSRRRGTIADRLRCAHFPRARLPVGQTLECTSQRLRYVYTRGTWYPEQRTEPEAKELSWSVDLSDLSWVRYRKSPRSEYKFFSRLEFGFADGSWITLTFSNHPEERREQKEQFLAALPAHVHVSSEQNPSRTLAKSLRREWNACRSGSGS